MLPCFFTRKYLVSELLKKEIDMRIDKLLANIGYGSRKEVKGLLKSGAVKVNEELIKDAKQQVDPDCRYSDCTWGTSRI